MPEQRKYSVAALIVGNMATWLMSNGRPIDPYWRSITVEPASVITHQRQTLRQKALRTASTEEPGSSCVMAQMGWLAVNQ